MGRYTLAQICHYNYNRKPSSHKKSFATIGLGKSIREMEHECPSPQLLCSNRRMCDPRPSWVLACHFSLCLNSSLKASSSFPFAHLTSPFEVGFQQEVRTRFNKASSTCICFSIHSGGGCSFSIV
eukprot:Gb_14241 [translate_table: standard]